MAVNQKEVNTVDWVTAAIYMALVFIGWLMIYSVGYGNTGYPQELGDFMFNTQIGKQTIWIGICTLAFLMIQVVDWTVWRTFAYLIYVVGILCLLAVPFLGSEINGQRAWFAFGGFSFQPAELGKLGTALALSSYMSSSTTRLQNVQSQMVAIGIFILPMMLIMLQPDAGSALVFLSFTMLLFREGFSPAPYILAIVIDWFIHCHLYF